MKHNETQNRLTRIDISFNITFVQTIYDPTHYVNNSLNNLDYVIIQSIDFVLFYFTILFNLRVIRLATNDLIVYYSFR